jgi:hypothetical protein
MLRKVLAFAGMALIAAACGNRSSLGEGDGNLGPGIGGSSGNDAGTWTPCGDKSCGDPCSVCDPSDAECTETAVLKYCDQAGQCGSAFPVCGPSECKSTADCPQPPAVCTPCPDGSYECARVDCIGGQCVSSGSTCPSPGQCTTDSDCPQTDGPCLPCPDGGLACPDFKCMNGQCVGGYPTCGWEPCAGKPCGAPCSDCSPNDPDCVETAVLKFCDERGGCGMAYPQCGGGQCTTSKDCIQPGAPCEICPDGSYACPGAECVNGQCVYSSESCGSVCQTDKDCPLLGAPCQKCADGTISCPSTKCVAGQCSYDFPGCGGYEPCAGKKCGDTCTQCSPNDPSCSETAVIKYCDSAGGCGPNYPTCGGGNECKSSSDCAVIAVCYPCPDGGCKQPVCTNGKCELVCPPPPNPQCKADSDCPAIAICKQCQDGRCAEVQCVAGQCQFVCGSTCGKNVCRSDQTCCNGMPFTEPTCVNGDICPISRAKYKTDIDYLDSSEERRLHDDLLGMRLATYRYKRDEADGRRHLGFIIDDVGPSPAVAPSGERVDLYGYTTMAVAALKTQSEELARLKRELGELRQELAQVRSQGALQSCR